MPVHGDGQAGASTCAKVGHVQRARLEILECKDDALDHLHLVAGRAVVDENLIAGQRRQLHPHRFRWEEGPACGPCPRLLRSPRWIPPPAASDVAQRPPRNLLSMLVGIQTPTQRWLPWRKRAMSVWAAGPREHVDDLKLQPRGARRAYNNFKRDSGEQNPLVAAHCRRQM